MDQTVENLCSLLVRSKLRSADSVKSVLQRWQGEAKDQAGNAQQFMRWLVSRQVVTEYQASLLAKGRVDEFFLNQYQILDRLGRGRMAGVYKAVHSSGQIVAVKVLPPSHAKDPQMLARFQRESKLAMRLRHPNVVRSFQVGKANNLHYLVMEYLDGETLDDTLQRRKRLPMQEAVRLMHQALMGLQHIHEMNMVHRDLKPANLMLLPAPAKGAPDTTLRATVKLLDIGLGRELFDEKQPAKGGELTTEETILGTPDYLAPEQARDSRTVDIRADIYSLGCVLYHLVTGQPPFPDKNLLNQMVRHAKETAKPLKDFVPTIPDGLQQIVNWMMAKQPTERYPTPERAAQAMQMFMLAEAEPARREDQPPPTMKKYLTWLETAPPEDAPVAEAAKAAPAVARPVAAPSRPAPIPAAVPATMPSMPAMPPTATPAPPSDFAFAADQIDVELVPVNNLPASRGLSHRDWMLLGIGAAIVALLILIALLLVVVMRGQ